MIKIWSLNIESFSEINIADTQKVKERNHNINTEVCLENPVLTNLWDKWSLPPWNGDTFLRSLDKTATVVSRIGIERSSTGIAKEVNELSADGLKRTVNVAINIPKNSAPASPI